MVIGVVEIRLRLPGIRSLKEKRSVIRPLLHRLRQSHNISVAETDCQDVWQSAAVTVACVAGDSGQAHSILEQVLAMVERTPDVLIIESFLEIL